MPHAVKSAGYSRNSGKRWRGSDVSALRMLVRDGASLRLISLKLGRPDNAIRAKANALGLKVNSDARILAPPPVRTLSRNAVNAPRLDSVMARTQLDLFGNA